MTIIFQRTRCMISYAGIVPGPGAHRHGYFY